MAISLSDGSTANESWMIEPDPSTFYTVGYGIWTSPAVDTVNHDIFVTTASAYEIQDGLAYSMVRRQVHSASTDPPI